MSFSWRGDPVEKCGTPLPRFLDKSLIAKGLDGLKFPQECIQLIPRQLASSENCRKLRVLRRMQKREEDEMREGKLRSCGR